MRASFLILGFFLFAVGSESPSGELGKKAPDVFYRIETEMLLGSEITKDSFVKLEAIEFLKSNEPLRYFYRAVIFASIGVLDKAYENNTLFLKAAPKSE